MEPLNTRPGRFESQRDSVIQPRVARHELPWVWRGDERNPEGVSPMRVCRRCNPVGVENIFSKSPRVVPLARANPGLKDAIPLGLKMDARFNGSSTP
jgi:hypothetical protein